MLDDLVWKSSAACRNADQTLFFPERDVKKKREGQLICETCPVRYECLQSALDHEDGFGTWGGLDQDMIRKALNKGYTEAWQVFAWVERLQNFNGKVA